MRGPKIVNIMDASRMTASTSIETANRVGQYFGDAGPFSYGKVRALTPHLLAAALPFEVLTAGIASVKFDLARKCNMDVAHLLAEVTEFRGCHFYNIKRLPFSIDKDFAIGIRPETVAVVNGVPNLIFLQPRKTPTPWPLNLRFKKRVLDEVFVDYFDEAKFWLVDTEAPPGGERDCALVALESVEAMSDQEFTRRISALRQAWRIHLSGERPKKRAPDKKDDRQPDLGFE